MAEAKLLEVPLSVSLCCFNVSASIRSAVLKKRLDISKFSIGCSYSSATQPEETSQPVVRSNRGKTRKSLGLAEVDVEVPASVSEPSRGEESSTSFHTTATSNVNNNNLKHRVENDILEDPGVAPFSEWTQKNREFLRPSKVPATNSEDFAKRIQDLINADLERKYSSQREEDDYEFPLFVDEEDPNWLDEPDEGWGFRVSDTFKENFEIKRVKNDDDEESEDFSDIPDIQWDLQPEKWSAKDVDVVNWTSIVLDDPSPLVVILYEKYGKKGRECYHVLRELEDAANNIWETKRLPPRLAKINVSIEVDLASILHVKEVPTLLFIKGGKLIHQQSGYHTADDLMRIISYFYYGAAKPACLKKVQPVETLAAIQ